MKISNKFMDTVPHGHWSWHTPSIAFRHLPPNSARTGYATEGALYISDDQRPPKGLGTTKAVEAT